jgi:hypothetical protein
MALQSSARIKGDDYQFLFTWLKVLDLKKRNTRVAMVKLEDPDAGQVDDVTVFYKDGSAPDYFQVKYHVDQRKAYSLDLLLEKGKTGTSLLHKFYKTYTRHLAANPDLAARLHLVSNWAIDPADKVLSTVENERGHLGDAIRTATAGSDIGKALEKVRQELKIDDAELQRFLCTMRFLTGRDCTEEFKCLVQDKMESLGLKSSENDLAVAVQIVRDWVKSKHIEVDLPLLEKILKEKDLFAPPGSPPSATVYLVTVKKHRFDLPPDYLIDLRSYYADQGAIKGHELLEGYDYNSTLLPRILEVQRQVNDETQATLIRARGFSRLSPWFAFGHAFARVSGYTIEVNQSGALWRTDERPTPGFKLVAENGVGETLASGFGVVAIGLSVSGAIAADVREHVAQTGGVDSLLILRPEAGTGSSAIQNAGDVVAMSEQFKDLARAFVREHKARRLLLYYFGPLSGACFIGHQLNAICNEVQIMEKLAGEGYVESFLLQ